jgi:hypothetical protein
MIKIDAKKLATIARESSQARLLAELAEVKKEQLRKEKIERQLTTKAKKKLDEILSSVPNKLEEAASLGYKSSGVWYIITKIPLASALVDFLHPGPTSFNNNLTCGDNFLLEAVEAKLWELNQNQQGMRFQLTAETNPNRPDAIVGVSTHFTTYFYLEVTLIVPESLD